MGNWKVGLCAHAEEVEGVPGTTHATAQERMCLLVRELVGTKLAEAG